MYRKKIIISSPYILVLLLFLCKPLFAADFFSEIATGYNGGTSFQLGITALEFAHGYPVDVRFGFGRSNLDPGKPAEARQIFINDATNGIPEEKGWFWNYRLDFLVHVQWFSWQNLSFYGGPRLAKFTGNFKYVGGNEDFDVKSSQWGFGIGLEKLYRMNERLGFSMRLGVDTFSHSILVGHDTTYNPDGDDVNPRKDYTFDDADNAINQPEVEFSLLLGIRYKL